MSRPGTQESYRRKLDRVLVHIAAHLDEELEVARLADIACLSPHHFHRIFRHLVGETVAEHVRRARLHRASGHLVQTSLPIADVAKRAGYGSVAAFTRAFSAGYGTTPALYRSSGRLVPLLTHPEPSDGDETMYEVTIRPVPRLRLAAMNHVGSYMEIGSCFERLMIWAGSRGLMGPQTRTFGIYFDDPAEVPEAELRSQATIDIPDDAVVEGDGVLATEIPACRCAVILHKGPYAELEGAYKWLYGTWLPPSGEEPADIPPFEEYKNDPREVPPSELLTEVYLPLKG